MKFTEKMCLMIILKVAKNQGFTLCLEDTTGGSQIDPSPPPSRLGLKISQNLREKICGGIFFNKIIKKESPTQMFSYEFCEIFKKTYFERLLLAIFPFTYQNISAF